MSDAAAIRVIGSSGPERGAGASMGGVEIGKGAPGNTSLARVGIRGDRASIQPPSLPQPSNRPSLR